MISGQPAVERRNYSSSPKKMEQTIRTDGKPIQGLGGCQRLEVESSVLYNEIRQETFRRYQFDHVDLLGKRN